MVRYSEYALSDIEGMIPYEFEIYTAILLNQLTEEKKKRNVNG
jgi:hypothetical protein